MPYTPCRMPSISNNDTEETMGRQQPTNSMEGATLRLAVVATRRGRRCSCLKRCPARITHWHTPPGLPASHDHGEPRGLQPGRSLYDSGCCVALLAQQGAGPRWCKTLQANLVVASPTLACPVASLSHRVGTQVT